MSRLASGAAVPWEGEGDTGSPTCLILTLALDPSAWLRPSISGPAPFSKLCFGLPHMEANT